MNKRIAVFAGSFNPFTVGHLNILEKAEVIFGKENVFIMIGVNPSKKEMLLDSKKDLLSPKINVVETIKQQLPSRNVEGFEGLLTDYIWEKEKEGYDVTLVRGLRSESDFASELIQLRYMQDLKPDLKSMFLISDRECAHVSSTGYRELEKIKPGLGYKYLAKED